MRTQALFILYDHLLFARGLEGLLRGRGGIEVVGVAPKSEEAVGQVTKVRPDVVLVEAGRQGAEAEVLLSRLLQGQHRARVIRVSLEDGTATLYSGRQRAADGAEELLKGILDLMGPELEEAFQKREAFDPGSPGGPGSSTFPAAG